MRIVIVAMLLLASTLPALARHSHHIHHARHHAHRTHYAHEARHAARVYDRGDVVSHPTGCPRSLFCGCGASVEIFGHSIRSLWLAANWFRFPRAEPAPGMAAVRAHHVMVIREYLGAGRARVYDANSGGGRTRVHVRSLAGYRIVDPRARAL